MTRAWAAIDRGVELLVAAILAVMLAVGALQLFQRFVLDASSSWSEEAQVFGHIALVFLGIPIAYRRGAHLVVETLRKRYPPLVRAAFDLVVELLWFSFAISLMALGWQVSRVAALRTLLGLGVPMSYPYYAMVAGGAYLALVAMRRMVAWGRQHIDRVRA